jgi:rod shape determining protein RodA
MIPNLLKNINFKILLPAIFIYLISLITINSTIPGLFLNHFIYFVLGICIFLVLTVVDVNFFIKNSFYFYILILFLLLLVYVIGHTALGASRWLKIGELSVQPSEFAKVSLILFLTKIWIDEKVWNFKFFILKNKFIKSLIVFLPLISFVLIQPDLGTSIIIFLVFFNLLLISPFNKKYILYFFIFVSIFSSYFWGFLHDYQRERVIIFLNPEIDRFGAGYNSIQATIAVGSGGLFGKGYSKGTQTQLNFLPIFWTDFLVATYAEEWGLLGLLAFLAVYTIFLREIKIVALKNSKPEFRFISIGILTYFGFQFIINFGMNIGLLPVTGIPVPFFSYGGTSLVSSFFLLGIINKISVEKL